jgi:hypothetical protein
MSRTVEIIVDKHREILTLYSRFRYQIDNPKVIEISCNDMMLPYLFELKKNYTSYTLNNIVELNSVPKIRLYEICKQYENLKTIKLEVDALQRLMCVDVATFKDFKSKRLDPAIRDINKNTDIMVSYVKNLSCRKVVSLTFSISTKEKVLEVEPIPEPQPTENEVHAHRIAKSICDESPLESLYLRCNKEYTLEQLFNLCQYVESSNIKLNVSVENYIYSTYRKIKIEGKNVKNLYKYTFTIIEKQINNYIFGTNNNSPTPEKKKRRETSYDIEEFKNLVEVHEVKKD